MKPGLEALFAYVGPGYLLCPGNQTSPGWPLGTWFALTQATKCALRVAIARGRLMTHVWQLASGSRHRDGDRQVRVHSVSARHECQCTIRDEAESVLPLVSMIELSATTVAERKGWALGDRQSEIRCVTFGCNLDIVFLWIRLQISEIKASYITIHKIYFIFWNPFKFRGLVRSHVLHALKNAHGLLEMCVQVKVMVTLRVRMLLMVRVRRSLSV